MILKVPAVGQTLDMGKKRVTYGFYQCLRSFRVENPEAVLGKNTHPCHCDDCRSHHPDVLPQVSKATETVDNCHDGRCIICLLPAECVVHSHTENLRLYHVSQCSDRS